MRAAVQYGPRDLRIEEVPEPVAGQGEIKVRIAYCGVCGTDPEIYEGTFGLMKTEGWPKGPKIEGHEGCGTIVDVGPGCRQGYRVGQRVAMNFRASCGACWYCRNRMEHFCTDVSIATGAFAEYAVYKESCIYPLPDDLGMERAALLEPLSVVVHVVDLAEIQPGRSVAILGAGTLGLMLVQLAVRAGAAKVLVSEPVAAKRELALRFGADVAVDPTSEDVVAAGRRLTDGRGFGTVIEASGNMRAAAHALTLADKCATVVWAAVYPDEATVAVNPFHMYATEMTIRAVNVSPYSFPRAMELLPKLDLDPIITGIRPLAELDEVLRTFRRTPSIKTLIAP